MATKWITEIICPWCYTDGTYSHFKDGGVFFRPITSETHDRDPVFARVGIEKDGHGNTYRVQCTDCGMMSQVGFNYPGGERIRQQIADATTKRSPDSAGRRS